MNLLSLVFLVATVACGVSATDYCTTTLCGPRKHIACNNNGKFARSCPSDARMINMTNTLKNVIVNAHNEKRNIVASGAAPNHNATCRMATIVWDDELASLATYNVKQCEIEYDDCHNTDAFKYSGQNLALMGYFEPLDSEAQLKLAVEMWYSGVKNSKIEYINSYPNNYQGPTIGHFTVMVAEKNIRIGCAASSYSEPSDSYKDFLFACNYATTNIINQRIYAACSTPASGCTKGKNPTYSSLCSTSEPTDYS